MNKGFTLIELLLTISVMVVVLFSSAPFFARFFNQNTLANATDQVAGELRKAQLYAMTGRQNGPWGVNLTGSKLTLFQGTSYATRTTALDESITFNAGVTITGWSDVVFAHATGLPSASPTVTVRASGQTKTVTVNSQGVASK